VRKIDYEDYRKKRKSYIKNKALLGTEKVSSSRLRDEKEREILARLDRLRFDKWSKDKTLIKIGPRKYKLSL